MATRMLTQCSQFPATKESASRRPRASELLFVFLAGFAARWLLIVLCPVVFGTDTILRLANRDRILFGYQLPAMSVVLYALNLATSNLAVTRLVLAAGGALAGVGMYCFATHVLERRAALAAALLFAFHPFLLRMSTVPYQESWMIGGLLFAFHFFLSGKHAAASAALAFACFTRYESWAACPVLAIACGFSQGARWKEFCKGIALYCWPPIPWIVFNRGITPEGGFVVEFAGAASRIWRYIYLGWITWKETPALELLLAAAGVWLLWKHRGSALRQLAAPAAFFAVFIVAILFSAHGSSPDPARFVTPREASLIFTAVALLAGFGIQRILRIVTPVVAVTCALSLWSGYRSAKRDADSPELSLSYALARDLDSRLSDHERVLILARPLEHISFQTYLDRAVQAGGPAVLEGAKSELDRARLEPTPYLRTVIHSHLPEDRFLTVRAVRYWRENSPRNFPVRGTYRYIALWSDYASADQQEAAFSQAALQSATELRQLSSGSATVKILRVANP